MIASFEVRDLWKNRGGTFTSKGGRGMMLQAEIEKPTAKHLFCLDNHDLDKLKPVSAYRKGHEMYNMLDIVKVCIARHGSLAGMQVYALNVCKKRERVNQRRNQHGRTGESSRG
jgi:hypothetical protein